MENNNLVFYACEIIKFRENILKACRKRGIETPTNEQISEFINDYGLHFDDFMRDFTEHEGMFRKATNDELIAKMKPLVKATYQATAKLAVSKLAMLWNMFIEESSLYGEDSFIYSLDNPKHREFLESKLDSKSKSTIDNAYIHRGVRYVQWLSSNDLRSHMTKSGEEINSIRLLTSKDMAQGILSYWEEIFERIMVYPYAYNFCVGEVGTYYFYDVFFPVITETLGYKVNYDDGKLIDTNNN